VANTLAAGMGYLAFGGGRLFGQIHRDEDRQAGNGTSGGNSIITAKHWVTLATIALLVVGVVGFHVHVGMGAFAAAVVLTLAGVTDKKKAILTLPWGVIIMVSGVTVLTSLLEKTGGIDLFTTFLARFATHQSVTGLIALVTGLSRSTAARRVWRCRRSCRACRGWSPSSEVATLWRSPRRF
jgi:Na+/H+ antiporter NhaD/arsenite permease-like protein